MTALHATFTSARDRWPWASRIGDRELRIRARAIMAGRPSLPPRISPHARPASSNPAREAKGARPVILDGVCSGSTNGPDGADIAIVSRRR